VPDLDTVTTALGIAGPSAVALLFLEADSAARKLGRRRPRAWLSVYPALAVGAALPRWAAHQDFVWLSVAWAGWAAIGAVGLVAASRLRRG
jgi:hypothetical protein